MANNALARVSDATAVLCATVPAARRMVAVRSPAALAVALVLATRGLGFDNAAVVDATATVDAASEAPAPASEAVAVAVAVAAAASCTAVVSAPAAVLTPTANDASPEPFAVRDAVVDATPAVAAESWIPVDRTDDAPAAAVDAAESWIPVDRALDADATAAADAASPEPFAVRDAVVEATPTAAAASAMFVDRMDDAPATAADVAASAMLVDRMDDAPATAADAAASEMFVDKTDDAPATPTAAAASAMFVDRAPVAAATAAEFALRPVPETVRLALALAVDVGAAASRMPLVSAPVADATEVTAASNAPAPLATGAQILRGRGANVAAHGLSTHDRISASVHSDAVMTTSAFSSTSDTSAPVLNRYQGVVPDAGTKVFEVSAANLILLRQISRPFVGPATTTMASQSVVIAPNATLSRPVVSLPKSQ